MGSPKKGRHGSEGFSSSRNFYLNNGFTVLYAVLNPAGTVMIWEVLNPVAKLSSYLEPVSPPVTAIVPALGLTVPGERAVTGR